MCHICFGVGSWPGGTEWPLIDCSQFPYKNSTIVPASVQRRCPLAWVRRCLCIWRNCIKLQSLPPRAPNMRPLTPRQQEILALIRQHIADSGFPPTRAEIARKLGFRSPNAAEEHLKALARKGVIELTSGASRGIRVNTMGDRSRRWWRLGRADRHEPAAGGPGRGRQPHSRAGAHHRPLCGRPRLVCRAARLPAPGPRHEHARCRHPRWRPARRPAHHRGP